jgi:hypothetical protein
MFAGKAEKFVKVDQFRNDLLAEALYLLANIRLGWKGLPGTNTLAFWVSSLVTRKTINIPPRTVFTTINFHHYLQKGPIS